MEMGEPGVNAAESSTAYNQRAHATLFRDERLNDRQATGHHLEGRQFALEQTHTNDGHYPMARKDTNRLQPHEGQWEDALGFVTIPELLASLSTHALLAEVLRSQAHEKTRHLRGCEARAR